MLAPNHRINPRLNIESFETELEKAHIKAKWEKYRENRSNEDKNKAFEAGEDVEAPKKDEESKSKVISKT